jgi:hypothetical protein
LDKNTWLVVTGKVNNTGLSFEKYKFFISPKVHDINDSASIAVKTITITATGTMFDKENTLISLLTNNNAKITAVISTKARIDSTIFWIAVFLDFK